jgi:methyltransferase
LATGVPFAAFVAVLLTVGAVRLVELAVSVRRLRARPGAVVPEPGVFPVMIVLHAAVVLAPIGEVAWLDRPFVFAEAAVALGVLSLGVALRVWTVRTLGRRWTVRVVVPAEGAIVTGGPYAFVRHPNYLAVILEVAALPMLHHAWLSALVLSAVNALVLARRIRTEEAVLMSDARWREAMSSRARLIPGVF